MGSRRGCGLRELAAGAAALGVGACAHAPWSSTQEQAETLSDRLATLSPFQPEAIQARAALWEIRAEIDRLAEGGYLEAAPETVAAEPVTISAALAEADVAPMRTLPRPVWRVQLGVFQSAELAQAFWSEVTAVLPELVDRGAPPAFRATAEGVRVSIGPFAEQSGAARVCAELTELGVACRAIAERGTA